MKIFTNHKYIVSKSMNYRSNKFVTSKQNFVDMMIPHKTKVVCSVYYTKSSNLELSLEQPNAISTKFLGQ
jgi:hypothetical protein